ncbi:ATP-dependent DNA ligase [Streptomyces sp. CB00316]|uniref:ATP-dependent DNA ligase n=1 Tax=unclassified Streptomyces TaxID=2593676 RepID=UPI00093DEF2A|nr:MULTISPECIES: ATP-dependent DNA ligase [unclassified Streptomyces]MBT2376879.1 ATP-dependent DNA ligase [Streptomyces sp. ISL-111]MBT2425819.1 ATP-dependent DNA ligase [Streptomyces sp. ISL-112]MBT2460802.1 ATP-dependent DNA ligase [Streptomyces sp. ISL-63]OKJ17913.1 ATP-dependent DNA ligase [Streptomyces sp. CB00316]
MLLAELAQVSLEVAATSARSKKVALLAALFRDAGPEDVPVVIPYLAGRLPQGRIGVGWRSLGDPVEPAAEPTLTVTGVDAELTALAAISGTGSQALRRDRLRVLFAAATADEQHFLRALLTGEVRQGALEAVAADALARAAEAPPADVRRAVMLAGSLQEVARTLLADGPGALAAFRLTVGRPVHPMLAHTAATVTEAVDKLGPCAVEEKLDGIRVQVHRDGDRVRAYTRTLDDITDRLPELVTAVAALETGRFILDGEVIALGDDGRPRPFQDTAARVGSRRDVAAAAAGVPIVPVFFDALSADGEDLLDLPFAERHAALARLVPEALRVRRALVPDPADAGARRAAEAFLAETLERGHEGVVVKDLGAAYSAGRRGASWLKVKPVHTLDLVVLAAEWGSGRRTGKLSNLHLGARRPDGTFAMLGKTFKGLTDALLEWQTEKLRALTTGEDGHIVTVRPELVVEIAYDGLQRSTRYPAGVTLRFARVLRYREDKTAQEADTVETVLSRQR